ncbi:laminin domain protein [Ceratobasidium sp. AG-Ba]|nr:laminin domain protein [Ceratobasidium sp. AG-Ba]
MHFLRLARDLCNTPTRKSLSPAFSSLRIIRIADSKESLQGLNMPLCAPLGRLKYTTGDTEGAVGIFLGLLRSSDVNEATKGDDDIYLEDFKLALEHLISTSGPEAVSHLKLPVRFCQPYKTQVRVGTLDGDDDAEFGKDLKTDGNRFGSPMAHVSYAAQGALKPKVC